MNPSLSIARNFRAWRLSLGLLFLLLPWSASAHLHDALTLNIPLNQKRTFNIYADVHDEPNPSVYSMPTAPNAAVAKVLLPHSFPQKIKGTWIIEAVGLGTTTAQFHWKYTHPNNVVAQNTLTVTINVILPVAGAGSNPWFVPTIDPVNSRSGEFYSDEAVDLSLGGPMPLYFARYYSSLLETEALATSTFGVNRLHNFDWKLTVESATSRVRITTDHGRAIYFERKNLAPAWLLSGRQDVPYQLVETAGIFRLADPFTQRIYTFDAGGLLTKVEDGRGNTHTLGYTGGVLATVIDGLGRTLTLTHTAGKLTRVTDHGGREVNFTYTGNNLATASDTLSRITTYNYIGNLLTSFARPEANVPFTQIFTTGKVTSQTDRTTDTSLLTFNPFSTVVENPAGDSMTHNYAPTGELTSLVDEAGKAITLTSDATGRRNTVTDRLGDRTTIIYHALSGKPATVINAEGKLTTMTYKSRVLNGHTFHDLAKITYPDASSRSFTYDAKGNVTQITDQAGKIWKFTRNTRGQVLTSTNPLGGVSTFTYNAAANLATSQEPDVSAISYTYDPLNRLTQMSTLPGPVTLLTAYNARDRITSITDERGKVYTFAYDNNDRLTTVTDPDTKTTGFAYDVLDRVTQVTDRLGKISGMTYNSRRLAESFTDPNGNATSIQYDSRQRPISTTDADGKVWPTGYDDEGQPISAATPINPPGKIKRNKLGQPVEFSDPLGNTERLIRDVMQRVTQTFDPLGRLTTYAYDKRGLLISATEQGTGTGKYDRDALGNITKITDPNGGIWAHTYTKAGRLLTSTDPLAKKWTYSYDTRGRLLTTTYPDTPTATLTYDAAGNVTRQQHSGGPDLLYTYDNLNRLSTADGIAFTYDFEGRLTNAEQNGFDFDATYDNGGRLVTVSYLDDAIVVTYQYDTRNRLTRVTDSVTTAQIDFTYDNAGRLTGMTRSNGVNGTYTYDAAGRHTRTQEGSVLDLQYTLNAAGDITSVDHTAPLPPAVAAPAQVFKFGKASQLITTGYAYDARGRLTSAPGPDTFTWDGASRLTSADGATLTYNGLHDVVERTASGNTTRFYNHYALGLSPIVYEDPQSGSDRAYVWTPEGELLYSIDLATSQPTFYHFDHIGSTLALTNAGGAVTDSYAYGPFGESMSHDGPSTQPFTYIGAYGVRTEGTLYQMRARYYDPVTARFLSRDPVAADLGDPKSLNPYQYALNSPLSFLDPEGTTPGRRGPPDRRESRKDRKARERAEDMRDDHAEAMAQLDAANAAAGIDMNVLCKPFGSGHSSGSSLFPLITNQAGFNSAEAIANTDVDPYSVTPGASSFINIGDVSAPNVVGLIVLPSNRPAGTGFKISENESPRPVDRIYLSYNYYQNVPSAPAPSGGKDEKKLTPNDAAYFFSRGGAADAGSDRVHVNGVFNGRP